MAAKSDSFQVPTERSEQIKQLTEMAEKNTLQPINPEIVQRAAAAGLNLSKMIILVRKYGPLVFEIIEGLLSDTQGETFTPSV